MLVQDQHEYTVNQDETRVIGASHIEYSLYFRYKHFRSHLLSCLSLNLYWNKKDQFFLWKNEEIEQSTEKMTCENSAAYNDNNKMKMRTKMKKKDVEKVGKNKTKTKINENYETTKK